MHPPIRRPLPTARGSVRGKKSFSVSKTMSAAVRAPPAVADQVFQDLYKFHHTD